MSDNSEGELAETLTNNRDIYEISGFSGNLAFFRYEKDVAVKIAQKWLDQQPKEHVKNIKEYLDCLFELWKNKEGRPPARGIFGLLNQADENISEEERLKEIEHLKPWEAAPMWLSTPIKLFSHINYSKFYDVPSHFYWDIKFWLIILSDQQNDKSLWPEMIKEGLYLSDILIRCFESPAEKYWNLKAKERERTGPLKLYNDAKKNEALKLKERVQAAATEYLKAGKEKQNIVSLLQNKGGFGISDRQIRRVLVDHPSGYWKPKSRQKK